MAKKRGQTLSDKIADYLLENQDKEYLAEDDLVKHFYKQVGPVTRKAFKQHLGQAKKILELDHGGTGDLVVRIQDEEKKLLGYRIARPIEDLDRSLAIINRSRSMTLGHKASYERKVKVAKSKGLIPGDQIPLLFS